MCGNEGQVFCKATWLEVVQRESRGFEGVQGSRWHGQGREPTMMGVFVADSALALGVRLGSDLTRVRSTSGNEVAEDAA